MKWSSIRAKLIIFLLLATVIPIVTTMIVTYSYTSDSLRKRVAEEDARLLYQGGRNLLHLMDNLNRSSSNIYTILTLIQGGYEDAQSNSRIYALLSNIATSVPDIFQIYLYENTSRKATLITLNTPQRSYDIEPHADVLTEDQSSVWLQTSHMSHSYDFLLLQPKYPSQPVFTLHRRIEKIPSSETVGYLSIDVSIAAVTDIVEQLYTKNREKIYLVDQTGNLVYSDDRDKLGLPLEDAWYKNNVANSEAGTGHFEQDGSVFVYHRIDFNQSNWTLIKQVPVSYLAREANRAAGINLLLLGISLLVIVIATIIISIRITSPIKQLGRYMNQIQSGNLHVDIQPVSGSGEVGLVIQRFKSMMDTINNLILREYRLELANKTNQLKAMQAQIHPHFLNNTLQIIGTLALELGVPRIYALLSALARMMRYSMYNDERTVTLKDELDHVKAYIELQKERFENRFEFRYEVDEQLLNLPICKLILQPIIENYFKHGLTHGTERGLVVLAVELLPESRLLQITISNNGKPIDDERLKELQAELLQTADAPSYWEEDSMTTGEPLPASIGLANVLSRIKLFYGAAASLHIANGPQGGVVITLLLPILDQTESEKI